jgi:hypothetical protein
MYSSYENLQQTWNQSGLIILVSLGDKWYNKQIFVHHISHPAGQIEYPTEDEYTDQF